MTTGVNVAIAGIGNCASALVQGISYYSDPESTPVGLLSAEHCAGYTVQDVQIVAAFDVSESKVGLDLSEAIFAGPNNTRVFARVPKIGVAVSCGAGEDGIGSSASERVKTGAAASVDEVTEMLVASKTDVLVNYLPVGSEQATLAYAQAAIAAGCAFVNCIPVFVARRPEWRERFEKAGLPLIGDDIKSQVGATIVHRALAELFSSRGIRLDRTYQLNFGGNMDFYNMQDRERLHTKRVSKAQAILDVSNGGSGMAEGSYHIAPSDYVPFLGDQKLAFVRLEGTAFGGAPLDIEVRMSVSDSPNSAGCVLDAVRYAQAARVRGEAGVIDAAAAWLMKAPPKPMNDNDARHALLATFGS